MKEKQSFKERVIYIQREKYRKREYQKRRERVRERKIQTKESNSKGETEKGQVKKRFQEIYVLLNYLTPRGTRETSKGGWRRREKKDRG